MRYFVQFANLEPNLKDLDIPQDQIQKIMKAVKDPSGYKLKDHEKEKIINSKRKRLSYISMRYFQEPEWELMIQNEYIKDCQNFEIHKLKDYVQTPESIKIRVLYKVDYFGDVPVPQFQPEKAVAGGI